jgi:hypothetical protein
LSEENNKKPKHVKSVIAILIAVAASLMGGDALFSYVNESNNVNNNNSGTIITDSTVDSIVDSIVNSTIDNSINTDIIEEGDDITIDNSTTSSSSSSNDGDTIITSGDTLIETVADTGENLDSIKTDIRTMKMELGRLSNLMSKHVTSEQDIADATEENMRIINANYHDLFSKIGKVRSEISQIENLQGKFDRIKSDIGSVNRNTQNAAEIAALVADLKSSTAAAINATGTNSDISTENLDIMLAEINGMEGRLIVLVNQIVLEIFGQTIVVPPNAGNNNGVGDGVGNGTNNNNGNNN